MLELDPIHTRIRDAREKSGLTQEEMADRIGIGRTTYINFETGRTRLFCNHLQETAAVLGVSEEELLFGPRPDEGLLRDQLALDAWKRQLVEDYENRLAELRAKLETAQAEIAKQEKDLDSFRSINKFLLDELGKRR